MKLDIAKLTVPPLAPQVSEQPTGDAPPAVAAMLDAETAAASDKEHVVSTTCRDAADWLNEADEPDEPLVQGLIERGENIAIVGQSKAGKSFICLQLAFCIALGLPFLGRETVRQRVYIANLEVSRKQYKKRLRKLCAKFNITPDALRGWLFVDNMKGEAASWQWCRDEAKRHGCTVVAVDPFYVIFKGDESDVQACAAAIDEMKVFQKDGFTLIVVYHSPKGFSGDRQLIDMISGSSMLARFPESIFGLLNHAVHKQCRVVKCVLRNYAPPEDQTIEFDEGAFAPVDNIAPIVQTGANQWNGKRQEQAAMELAPLVLDVLNENGMQKRKGTLVEMVRKACNQRNGFTPGEKKVAATITAMVDHGELIEADRQPERGGAKPIGLPEQMEWFTKLELPTATAEGKGSAR